MMRKGKRNYRKEDKEPKYCLDEIRRVEALRQDKDRWIILLESLLLDAEDMALYRGDWGLVDAQTKDLSMYQSLTCSKVIDNIRARATGRPS